MTADGESEITVLLRRWKEGDSAAYDLIVERTWQRLVAIASAIEARERDHTNPAGLVSETYLRLRQVSRIDWENRQHFFSFAAREIRRVLIDRARERLAAKRGGESERVPLGPDIAWTELPDVQILDLERALEELREQEPGLAGIVELHYLIGYTHAETAVLTGISEAAVERDLRFARAWLNQKLAEAHAR